MRLFHKRATGLPVIWKPAQSGSCCISPRGFDIEVLFGDGKEELGLDHYQLMSALAIVRFWTLAMLAYVFLEEERTRLQAQWQGPATIGQARREIQRRHRRKVLDWLHAQFQSGIQPDSLYEVFAA